MWITTESNYAGDYHSMNKNYGSARATTITEIEAGAESVLTLTCTWSCSYFSLCVVIPTPFLHPVSFSS
jgi:hypothetical protein